MAISAIVTYVLYSKTLTWGSLWCWLVNLASLFIIGTVFYDDVCIYYKKNNKKINELKLVSMKQEYELKLASMKQELDRVNKKNKNTKK